MKQNRPYFGLIRNALILYIIIVVLGFAGVFIYATFSKVMTDVEYTSNDDHIEEALEKEKKDHSDEDTKQNPDEDPVINTGTDDEDKQTSDDGNVSVTEKGKDEELEEDSNDKSFNDYLIELEPTSIPWESYDVYYLEQDIAFSDSVLEMSNYIILYAKNNQVEMFELLKSIKIPSVKDAQYTNENYIEFLGIASDEALSHGAYLSNNYDVIDYSNVLGETVFTSAHLITNNDKTDGSLIVSEWINEDGWELINDDSVIKEVETLAAKNHLNDKLGRESINDGEDIPDDDTSVGSTVTMFGNPPYEEGCYVEYYYGTPSEMSEFVMTGIFGLHVKDGVLLAVEDIIIADLINPEDLSEEEFNSRIESAYNYYQEDMIERANGQEIIESFTGKNEKGVISFSYYVYDKDKARVVEYKDWPEFAEQYGYEKRVY